MPILAFASFVSIAIIAIPQIIQGNQSDEERVTFSAKLEENEKFITILAVGNGTTRNAHLTVFEVLSDSKLRRLHSRFLVNKCSFAHACLCGGGRFFVSTNHFGMGERTNPLVVYDLVRNEYTAYAISELFSQEQQRQIQKTMSPISLSNDLLSDDLVYWSQSLYDSESHFDAKHLSFTIYAEGPPDLEDWRKAPELLKVEKPFISVVVDLPTRVAKAVASSASKDLRPRPEAAEWDTEKHAYINCDQQVTIDDAIFNKLSERILLPRLLQVHFLNPECKKVYRLNADSQEYLPVDVKEWRDIKPGENLCSTVENEK